MRINHNIAALNTYRQLGNANAAQQNSMEKLSSGLRINSAADDAAGLAISEKMRGQIRGLDMASRNAQDGISMIQTAEGGLGEIQNIVQRLRELGVQASSETYNSDDISEIQKEANQLLEEIDSIATNTKFNGTALLDGNADFDIASQDDKGAALNVAIADMQTTALGDATNKLSTFKDSAANALTDRTTAQALVDAADGALKQINDERAVLGAKQNRLETNINRLENTSENLTAAESRIRDVDYALAA